MSRRFFAPGKLVILGEYAVLDGAPAVVLAVDMGVTCSWNPSAERHIQAPGDDTFVRAALDAARVTSGRWHFGDWGLPDLPSKPGIGGSAAATVVATLAAHAVAKEPLSTEELFERAFAVHHAVQGSGSGVDVAASARGGWIALERGQITPQPPPSAELVVVWSGASARTGPRVERYLACAAREEFVAATRAAVDQFVSDPVGALDTNRLALEAMANAAGIAYRTPALDRIAELARIHGGAAKASGAGGGDCAVGLFPDSDAAEAFREACRREGYAPLPARPHSGASEVFEPEL